MSAKRLDMNHGFMKSIIKNQVERDKYEKEVQEEKRSQHSRGVANNSVGKKDRASNSRANEEADQEELLLLEFEDAKGFIHKIPIFKSDTPQSAAERTARIVNIPERLTATLKVRLESEFKRVKNGNLIISNNA